MNRRTIRRSLFGIAAGALVIGGGIAANSAFAEMAKPSPSSHAAVNINGQSCGLLDGDGKGKIGDTGHTISTNGGKTIMTCSIKHVPNTTGKALRYDFASEGYACGTPNGATEDWRETVSASGNATLTCIFTAPTAAP